jgi:acyl-coenzyme A synthetase/AMP-(fatty) acid ligase
MRGSIVKAYVVLASEAQANQHKVRELQDFVKQEIAPYKYPREIEFVTELPRTHNGKLRRTQLLSVVSGQAVPRQRRLPCSDNDLHDEALNRGFGEGPVT